jgi:AbiV family abortive infection protein
MRTKKAKAELTKRTGDMRRFMALSRLYGVCLSNAEALLSEATLLFEHGHFARAYALAYTGWEEVGKAQLTGDYAYEMVSEKEFESAYSDHKTKSAYNWRQFVLNIENIDDSSIEYDRGKANEHFAARQNALYVNKTCDLHAVSPKESISEETAKSAIDALSKELSQIRLYDSINERMGSKSFLK